jgi:GNAT superfamily N-acetyltransferase
MTPVIRPVSRTDHTAWLEMVLDYDPDVSDQAEGAWRRFFDPASSAVCRIVAVDGIPAGFMHYQFHDFCFSSGPVAYLSDLYIAPAFRRQGIARMLLDYLVEMARTQGWSRLYWVTEHDNPARTLYDEIGKPEFVRYHVDF